MCIVEMIICAFTEPGCRTYSIAGPRSYVGMRSQHGASLDPGSPLSAVFAFLVTRKLDLAISGNERGLALTDSYLVLGCLETFSPPQLIGSREPSKTAWTSISFCFIACSKVRTWVIKLLRSFKRGPQRGKDFGALARYLQCAVLFMA